ncbi:hypothetical protein LUZ61_015394 [Rhynchospora tenuis]|uniref:Aminotransferase-like plant mobile domain-containing protein n=1 Tax=Rhynchospora tenuis TaxID=198213 RepID=A0AAD5WCM2_9POAL|nr:hypothetical protein LUZ61_015394 [Rhynchospora tenuis]
MTFTMHKDIVPILERFRLDKIAQLGTIKIDRDLISALVERWRSETHTFHLPVGEMTVTLEDVSCLWGLPIDGKVVCGDSDENWADYIEFAFGRIGWEAFRRPPGTYHLNIKWLREPWVADPNNWDLKQKASLHDNSSPEVTERYARAFMMDLFGSVMFPDHSGYLPTMYIQFVMDVKKPNKYSWASAVLAHLYRQLCHACVTSAKEIAGPLVLLQMWAWTHFPIGRPKPQFPSEGLAGQPFGMIWAKYHKWEQKSKHGVSSYRDNSNDLVDTDVNWNPYANVVKQVPPLCRKKSEKELWFYKGPLVHFWAVEYYTPERVMRQFGKQQLVPPPISELNSHDHLHDTCHEPLSNVEWEVVHAKYLFYWDERADHIVPHEHPYDFFAHQTYIKWFHREGMPSVWYRTDIAKRLYNPPTPPVNSDPLTIGYRMRGENIQATVIRNLLLAKEAVGGLLEPTRRVRRLSKKILRVCRGNLEDVSRGAVMDNFLSLHGVVEEDLADSSSEEEGESSQQVPDYSWLDNLLGGNYSSQLVEPIYYPRDLLQLTSLVRGESLVALAQAPKTPQIAANELPMRKRRAAKACNASSLDKSARLNQRHRQK